MAVNLTKRIKGMFAIERVQEANLLPKSLVRNEFLTKLRKFLLTIFV